MSGSRSERHAESFSNRVKKKAKRANFIGNFVARKRENESRKRHYLLIGELCVHFSNLEQQIKNLLRRFDDNEKHEWRSGKGLVNAFTEALKKSHVDQEVQSRILDFLNEFLPVAEERHDALKALYSYNTSDNQMVRVNQRVFDHFDRFDDWDTYVKAWVQPFDAKQHQQLIDKTKGLSQQLLRIEHKFFHRLPSSF